MLYEPETSLICFGTSDYGSYKRTETWLYQPVMDVIQGEKQYQLIKLTLESGESIETTAEHPFYIQGKGWNAANTLKVGDALQLYNGTVVVVKTVDTSVRVERVYNLTVANTHNYFVGSDGVLVHNCKRSKRAPEYYGGQLTESKFLDRLENYLGDGYYEAAPGRWVSKDGTKQVRYGNHETKNPNNHHAHFETYGPDGSVSENTYVDIIPD